MQKLKISAPEILSGLALKLLKVTELESRISKAPLFEKEVEASAPLLRCVGSLKK
jgi:uncharacterized small protein (DUF1192 family)